MLVSREFCTLQELGKLQGHLYLYILRTHPSVVIKVGIFSRNISRTCKLRRQCTVRDNILISAWRNHIRVLHPNPSYGTDSLGLLVVPRELMPLG